MAVEQLFLADDLCHLTSGLPNPGAWERCIVMISQDDQGSGDINSAVLRTAKFVRDENTRKLRKQIQQATDPGEIERLNALIVDETKIYAAALAAMDRESREVHPLNP